MGSLALLECGCELRTWRRGGTYNHDIVTAVDLWRDDFGAAWCCPLHGWSAELRGCRYVTPADRLGDPGNLMELRGPDDRCTCGVLDEYQRSHPDDHGDECGLIDALELDIRGGERWPRRACRPV